MHKADTITEHLTKEGTRTKIITDNEFNAMYIREFLSQRNVQVHFTKSNAHTGNADIERLHGTIAEILLTMKQEESVTTQQLTCPQNRPRIRT